MISFLKINYRIHQDMPRFIPIDFEKVMYIVIRKVGGMQYYVTLNITSLWVAVALLLAARIFIV